MKIVSLRKIATVLTIHNIGYQGLFDSGVLTTAGLSSYLFNMEALEFYGKVNILKGGIMFSDVINTVSPTYAKEIQTKEYGFGLEGDFKDKIRRSLRHIKWDRLLCVQSTNRSLYFSSNKKL